MARTRSAAWLVRPTRGALMDIYRRLLAAFGPRHWWPAESPFEVVVGAILTQNCAWRNVEKALAALKERGLLTPEGLRDVPDGELEALIRPTGYYRTKARKLKAFMAHLWERYGGRLDRMAERPLDALRPELLSTYGVGPETADAILLYALGKASFVVDAYTVRILARLGYLDGRAGYEAVRTAFMEALPADAVLFNEFHAQLDALGSRVCLKRDPRCDACPLLAICPFGAGRAAGGG